MAVVILGQKTDAKPQRKKALSFGLAIPALAQSDESAAQSMKAAGESMQNVGSDVTKAAEHEYGGAATVVRDTKITVKVKTALREDSATSSRVRSPWTVEILTSSFSSV